MRTVFGAGRCRLAGYQLAAHDRHAARSVDAQPDLAPLDTNHRDANVVTDEKLFHELTSQHQHVCLPLGCVQVH
jgi:hypothetical protein